MQSFLTTAQKRDLVRYVVANGQSYKNYLRWADANLIPPESRYTERSFKAWCDKRRRVIQEVRQDYRVAVRQSSIYDRELRISKLEAGVTRMDAAIEALDAAGDKYVDNLVRLEEQKRKLMETIAKERGEWGNKPTEENQMANQLAATMMSVFAEQKVAEKAQLAEATIEGEYIEVPDTSTA